MWPGKSHQTMLIRSNAGLLGLIIISHNIRRFFSGAISQPAIEPMLSECCQSFSSLLTETTSHEEETIDFLRLLHISMLRCIHSSFSNCKQAPESKGEISIGDLCLGIFRQNLVTISSQIHVNPSITWSSLLMWIYSLLGRRLY